MSACTARPTYGVAEFVALLLTVVRPWLDAFRAEFARQSGQPVPPVPVPAPAPQVEPTASPEPVADTPVVVECPPVEPVAVAEVPAVEIAAEVIAPAVEVPYTWEPEPAADEVLYVKRGTGRGARYVEAAPQDAGPRYRRKRIGRTRTAYVTA